MHRNRLHYLEQPQEEPAERPAAQRRHDFAAIRIPYSAAQIRDQAARCPGCGSPFCQWKCPLGNRIPKWLALAQSGRITEAAELMHQTNCLPEVCGRVCPQERLCESACVLSETFGVVTIGSLEQAIADSALESGWQPDLSAVRQTGKRVAVIGAGPAGLACADALIRRGVGVVVYDRQPEIGGLLTFGIPAFKLEKSLILRRRALLTAMGVEFRLGVTVGQDIALTALQQAYDALFIAAGADQAVTGGLEQPPGVCYALPYLSAVTRRLMSLPEVASAPYTEMKNQRVLVLGGGDTAMDCLRTAIRQGAAQVTCVCRERENTMSASAREVRHAREEGAEFCFNRQSLAVLTGADGRVSGIRVADTQHGEESVIAADRIIIAFGFTPQAMPWLMSTGVCCDEQGRITAPARGDYPYQTTVPGIFAGGDVVRGADLVVTAMADGRQAAEGILAYLGL